MNENLKQAAEGLVEDIEHTMQWAAKNAGSDAELTRFRIELLHAVMGTKELPDLWRELARAAK